MQCAMNAELKQRVRQQNTHVRSCALEVVISQDQQARSEAAHETNTLSRVVLFESRILRFYST